MGKSRFIFGGGGGPPPPPPPPPPSHYYAMIAEFGAGIQMVDLLHPLIPNVGLTYSLHIQAPVSCAVSKNGLFGLVPNSFSGDVTPINLLSPGFPIASPPVAVGPNPQGIAIADNDSFALVTLTIISGAGVVPLDLTNPLVPLPQLDVIVGGVGCAPVSLDIAPDCSFAVVLLSGEDLLVILDLSNPLVPVPAASVIVPRGKGVAITPDGKTCICSGNTPSNTITPVDLTHPFAPIAAPSISTGGGGDPFGVSIASNGLFGLTTIFNLSKVLTFDLTNPLVPVLGTPTNLSPGCQPYSITPAMIFAH